MKSEVKPDCDSKTTGIKVPLFASRAWVYQRQVGQRRGALFVRRTCGVDERVGSRQPKNMNWRNAGGLGDDRRRHGRSSLQRAWRQSQYSSNLATFTPSAKASFSRLSSDMLRAWRSTCATNDRSSPLCSARSSCDQLRSARRRRRLIANTSRAGSDWGGGTFRV